MKPRFLPVVAAFSLLSMLSCVPSSAQTRTWTKSLSLGASHGQDLPLDSETGLSAQINLFHVPERSDWAPGGELGILGLGKAGFGTEAIDGGPTRDGPTHYGSVFLGAGIRRVERWGRRVRPYVGAGSAIHLVRTPGLRDPADPPIQVRPGASISAGIYGLAPGNFGIEARMHIVAAGKGEGIGGPLVIYSVLAGFNAP